LDTTLPSLADVLVVIALIVPGFLAFQCWKEFSLIQKDFSDLETIVWSLIASLLINIPFISITKFDNIDKMTQGIMFSPKNLLILLTISISLGAIGALAGRYGLAPILPANDCWTHKMNQIVKKGSYVLIYTKDGKEYYGYLKYIGTAGVPHARDLLLGEPRLITRKTDWKIESQKNMGEDIFFPEQDIGRIVFLKSKPKANGSITITCRTDDPLERRN
jgi:Family of unknown function (DUF6338)